MKKYIGVKLIEAEPFYSTDKEQEGYKVKYEDGYISWSPKDVFEKAYLEFKPDFNELPKVLEPHQMRVLKEHKELLDKTKNLDVFVTSPDGIYSILPEDEKVRLTNQLLAMKYYLTVLTERINHF